jgi:hypothetical protein
MSLFHSTEAYSSFDLTEALCKIIDTAWITEMTRKVTNKP